MKKLSTLILTLTLCFSVSFTNLQALTTNVAVAIGTGGTGNEADIDHTCGSSGCDESCEGYEKEHSCNYWDWICAIIH